MRDTSDEFDRRHRAMLMACSGEARLRMGAEMFDSAIKLMRAGIEATDAPSNEFEMREILLRRLYGAELASDVRRAIARRHAPVALDDPDDSRAES